MVILYIFLSLVAIILLLLLLVLFSPLAIRIRYCGELVVYVSLLFVRKKVFPKKEKNKKERRKRKEADKKPEAASNEKSSDISQQTTQKNTETESDKKPTRETLSLILDILKSLCDMMGKKAKIRIDLLKVVISKPDAADTAIQFGLCSGIVSSILAFTSNFGKSVIKDENVSIAPDFITGKSRIETDITVSARVSSILAGLVLGVLKHKSKK